MIFAFKNDKKKETEIVSKITTASIFIGQVVSYLDICLVSTQSWEFVEYKEWHYDLAYHHHGGGHG